MEHALAATTGEEYDHSNDLGMGGGPKMDGIGSREQDYATLYKYLDENFPGRYIKDWCALVCIDVLAAHSTGLDTGHNNTFGSTANAYAWPQGAV